MNLMKRIRNIPNEGFTRPELRRMSAHNAREKDQVRELLEEEGISKSRWKYLDNQMKMLKLEYHFIVLAYKNC